MTAAVNVDSGELSLALTSHDLEYRLDLQTGDVFPWFDDMLEDDEELAAALEETPDRFVRVEPVSSHESFRWMEDFAASQKDDAVREALLDALDRPRPFRRFKDALADFPEVREAWFRAHEERVLAYARTWIESEGLNVRLVTTPPAQSP
jgi:hypothetical protein